MRRLLLQVAWTKNCRRPVDLAHGTKRKCRDLRWHAALGARLQKELMKQQMRVMAWQETLAFCWMCCCCCCWQWWVTKQQPSAPVEPIAEVLILT